MASAPLMLLVSTPPLRCALPVEHVRDVSRPGPVAPLGQTPGWCLGAVVLRGVLTPVIDLGALLCDAPAIVGRRLVTVDAGGRRLALLVSDVLGVRPMAGFEALPTVLGALPAVTGALVDAQVTLGLAPARLVPDAVWAALAEAEARRREAQP